MRFSFVTLILAATAIPAVAPAAARDRPSASSGFTASRPAVRVHRGSEARGGGFSRDDPNGRDRDRDHDRGRYGGDTYFPYRDYQGNSLWRSDSFNDWWHDRPDRAYPRWVGGNADTCKRIWSSGSGWRC